jgi:hypothetical protein
MESGARVRNLGFSNAGMVSVNMLVKRWHGTMRKALLATPAKIVIASKMRGPKYHISKPSFITLAYIEISPRQPTLGTCHKQHESS